MATYSFNPTQTGTRLHLREHHTEAHIDVKASPNDILRALRDLLQAPDCNRLDRPGFALERSPDGVAVTSASGGRFHIPYPHVIPKVMA